MAKKASTVEISLFDPKWNGELLRIQYTLDLAVADLPEFKTQGEAHLCEGKKGVYVTSTIKRSWKNEADEKVYKRIQVSRSTDNILASVIKAFCTQHPNKLTSGANFTATRAADGWNFFVQEQLDADLSDLQLELDVLRKNRKEVAESQQADLTAQAEEAANDA